MSRVYTVDITNGSGPTAITNAATVLAQLTTSAARPIRIRRIFLESSFTGSAQAIIPIAIGTYATATSTGGVTPTPKDVNTGNASTASTAVRSLTATLGTTLTTIEGHQWNLAVAFERNWQPSDSQLEFPVSKVIAIVATAGGGTPSITGTIEFEEFG